MNQKYIHNSFITCSFEFSYPPTACNRRKWKLERKLRGMLVQIIQSRLGSEGIYMEMICLVWCLGLAFQPSKEASNNRSVWAWMRSYTSAKHSSLLVMKPQHFCLHGQSSCSVCIQNGRRGFGRRFWGNLGKIIPVVTTLANWKRQEN